MAYKLAEAYVEFSQKGVNAVRSGVDRIKGSAAGATTSLNAMSTAIGLIGGAVAVRGLWSFVEAAAEAEKQTAKLEAVLASTGGVSGQTVASLEAHASALQAVTAFEDDTVKGAQAVLLTFKKISGETFPQATEAALDLATVFEMDLKGSAMMLGKALEDPIRGITALRRAGVSFTADQQNVIKALVETGKVAEAQAMILKELNSQVGGSAKKVGDTTFGQIEQLKNALGDLAEMIGDQLTPVVKATVETIKQWQLALGGTAQARENFGNQSQALGKRFLEAKTAEEAAAIQKEYFALVKEMRANERKYGWATLDVTGESSMFGSRAANSRIAQLQGEEDDQRRRFEGAKKAGQGGLDVAGAIGKQVFGPAMALGDTLSKKIDKESNWLSKQLDSTLRQERLLQNIYDRLAPTEQGAVFE
jgi:phage-related minor tail protein